MAAMAEEKTKAQGDVSLVSPQLSDGSDTGIEWTVQEEKALVRKIDFFVMPILWLSFFALQLDRGNIGNAMTDNFIEDTGITQTIYNIGGSMLSLGIVLFEIPSNIVLMRIGPKLWIGGQIIAWGFVATFQAFQHGVPAFLVTRILLGICEAGFIPAALYTLSLWYKTDELSKRFSIFFTGNILASASGSLMAFGILHMRGVAGLTGWQWLFLLEGMFTVLAGIIFIATFPGSPLNPVSICGLNWFTEREIDIMRERVLMDDTTKSAEKHIITGKELLTVLSDWKLWPHLILPISSLTPGNGFQNYGPTIIASLGYGSLEANALASVGTFISAGLLVLAGLVADKTGRRGFVVIFCICVEFIFICNYTMLPDDAPRNTKYAIFTLSVATILWWHPVNNSWLAVNAKSPAERSLRMACVIMGANIAGIIGSQLFQAQDKPYYHTGFRVILGLVAVGITCSIISVVTYAVLNAKAKKRYGVGSAHDESGEATPDTSSVPGLRLYNY